jgi:hypothetical protein
MNSGKRMLVTNSGVIQLDPENPLHREWFDDDSLENIMSDFIIERKDEDSNEQRT